MTLAPMIVIALSGFSPVTYLSGQGIKSAARRGSRFSICTLLMGLVAWLTLIAAPLTEAATYTVSSAGDSGAGTLRAAIAQANVTPGADTIVFSQSLIDSAATIVLDREIGPVVVAESIDILVPGQARITLDANGLDSALIASTKVSMKIEGLRIVGAAQTGVSVTYAGVLKISRSEFRGNRFALGGGRIEVRNSRFLENQGAIAAGRTTVMDSVFEMNTVGRLIIATYGTIRNSRFIGNDSGQRLVDLNHGIVGQSQFVENHAPLLSVTSGVVSRSEFKGGRGSRGGAIDGGWSIQVIDSYFHDNQGTSGGAISARGTVLIANSTFLGNGATSTDPWFDDGSGGAILFEGGHLVILGSTFSGNQSSLGGGAVAAIRNGMDPHLVIRNSVFESSQAGGSGREIQVEAQYVDLPASSNNIFSDPGSPLFIDGVNGNRVLLTSSLGPVARHEAYPPFLPPLPDAALIDAGTDLELAYYGIDEDARGQRRISGLGVDIGAVETDGVEVGFFQQGFESAGPGRGGKCETLTPGMARTPTVRTDGHGISGLSTIFGAWPPAPGASVDVRLQDHAFVAIPMDVPQGTEFTLEFAAVPAPYYSSGMHGVASDCIGAPGTLHAAPAFSSDPRDSCSFSTGSIVHFNQSAGSGYYPHMYCDLEFIEMPMLNLAPTLSTGTACPMGGCSVRIIYRPI